MKIGKRIITLCLILSMSVGFAFSARAEREEAGEGFVPVLRFIASSDTHVRDDDSVTMDRIGKMLDLGYGVSKTDASYQKLDALLVAGDLTHDGTKTEFRRFWRAVKDSMRGETQFFGVVAKNHDGYKMQRQELRDFYSELTGNDADFHAVIHGYHFIGVSVSSKNTKHYDEGQLQWLKEQLDAAAADDPDKPIFVIHHEHVQNTVYGSSVYDGWGVSYFTEILEDYPQVVDFSGHSHYPLNDPRSIWQGDFTAIGTGAVYYAEFTVDRTRTYHPDDAYQTATCWIVEVDAANRIRLRGMDIETGICLCEYILDNPADRSNRSYTPQAQMSRAKNPSFDENAKLEVDTSGFVFDVHTPVAQSMDGMPVVLYRAYIKNALGVKVVKDWTLPSYYRGVQQNEIRLLLKHFGCGEYTVGVIAENAYGGQSAPIETTVTVSANHAFTAFFSYIAQYVRNLIYLLISKVLKFG